MSIVNVEALKGLGAQLWWPGSYAESGAYDDDGNKRGFMILPDGVTVTPTGTFTTQKMKDGRNVWKFDGSTNYISLTDNDAWCFGSGDFTICVWTRIQNNSDHNVIIKQYQNTSNQCTVYISSYNRIDIYAANGGVSKGYYNCPLTPVANTWYHIVVQRSGSSCIMYINGVAQTVTQITAFGDITDINGLLYIGSGNPSVTSEMLNGNIKDLMIFKGRALSVDQIAAIMAETYIY